MRLKARGAGPEMAIVGMLHVALGVSDMKRSLAFYRDVLGFALVRELELSGDASGLTSDEPAALCAALLVRDGLRLELLQRVAGAGDADEARVAHRPLTHLAVAVDDLASTLHSLRDRGVDILPDTVSAHAPGVASCLIRDPDGLAIALYQAPAGVASPWDR